MNKIILNLEVVATALQLNSRATRIPLEESENEAYRRNPETVMRAVKGWINYHNVSDNELIVDAFRKYRMRIIFKWLKRKGRHHSMS